MRQFLFMLILMFVSAAAESQPVTRKILLEWEDVSDSVGFELEFRRYLSDGKLKKPIYFRSKSTSWSGSVVPGKYQIRIRSMDDRKVWGEWGEPFEHWVRLLPPEMVNPTPGQILTSKGLGKSKVLLEWKERPGSKGYKVEVFNENKEPVFSEFTSDTSLKVELDVANNYLWHVVSVMPEESELGDPPAAPQAFTLRGGKLAAPSIERPDDQFVEEIEWQESPKAKLYNVTLQRKEASSGWKTLQSWEGHEPSKIPINPEFPGGEWRVLVVAAAPLFESSAPAKLEFNVYDGLRTPKAIEEARRRQAIEQARDQYWIASYLITSVDYMARFGDLNGIGVKFNAISGTGRLGYGRFGRKAQWGTVLIADYGGMIINGKNHTYATAELQGIWRTYYRGVTQLRLYGGLTYSQKPQAKGSALENVVVSNITTGDLTVGLQLWQPLTKKLGLQLNQQTIYSAVGLDLPSGASLSPTISYQLGFMGSYKLRDHVTGLAGYAYRHSELEYKAGGASTNVQIDGHFLNLYLEWGF